MTYGGKQVVLYELLPDATCGSCGIAAFGFRCKTCLVTVCVDCDCPCRHAEQTSNIDDATVEKATSASWEMARRLSGYWLGSDGKAKPVPPWSDASERDRDFSRTCIRAALTAALPALLPSREAIAKALQEVSNPAIRLRLADTVLALIAAHPAAGSVGAGEDGTVTP